MSDKSGSVPGSDFDDQEPDFLRETSPPRLEKAESLSDSDSQPLGRPRRGRHRRIDVEDLNAATEETLKSITSMLEDMPLASGFSSNSNSPNHFFDDFPVEPQPILKPERPFRNPRDPVRRRKHHDLLRPTKRKDIRTIERLQPGKSKGNLIANLPKPKDLTEESGLSLGLSLGRAIKESRNALLVKTDDAGPKLSLGTVLTSDILDFGKNKHNFDAMATGEVMEVKEEDIEEKTDLPVEEVRKSPVRNSQPVLPVAPAEEKEEEAIINKENDPVIEKPKEDVSVGPEEKKRDGVKEITNKATPNASAWFKAFGAPKAPAAVKKKPEAPEPAPVVEEKETAWGAASAVPVTGAPRRQRKASSSSSMSEPSSLSQDSPLHPVSPGLVSPRGEPPAPPVNGTLRVGFYQDMSSVHKCSPEKQSPHSTHSSPRELSNPSPFQGYSHVYPPSSPGTYSNYTVPTPAPPPQPLQPPSSLYDNLSQYPSYPEQYRQPQPVRTLESYSYKPPDPVPKPNPSIFPVKKRLFANMDVMRPLDVLKETQASSSDVGVNHSIYKDPVDRYPMDPSYQQRSMGQYIGNSQEEKGHQPIHQPPELESRLSAPQPDLSRLAMPPDLSRSVNQDESPLFHPNMMNMPMAEGKPKYPGADRSLSAMIESLGRMPSPARGFSSPLERLMQPPLNTIQEDSDGVFRNKYSADSAYPPQRHQPPVSTSYSSPNLSHMVDRYEDDRLLSSPYYDKNLYLKNVATSSSLPIYQDPSANAQSNYELNIPKPRDPKPSKRKKVKGPEAGGTTAFQQYVGLKPTEPSVPPISLKTTSAVPGSAFNFGPGLNNSLYSEGYLDELRQPAYYGVVGGEKPAFLAPPARGASYPLPQYMGHQSGLVEGYQQYLQRVQEEQLRHSLAYPAGYHPALGMRPAYDRPSWL